MTTAETTTEKKYQYALNSLQNLQARMREELDQVGVHNAPSANEILQRGPFVGKGHANNTALIEELVQLRSQITTNWQQFVSKMLSNPYITSEEKDVIRNAADVLFQEIHDEYFSSLYTIAEAIDHIEVLQNDDSDNASDSDAPINPRESRFPRATRR